jgi:arylsulfatase A-like enzyme
MKTGFNMKSPFIILILPVLASALSADPISLEASTQPKRIIFILSDDHRHDYMGFTGVVPWLETPAMDRLAREGAHFTNAYVTTSLCSPSRASILTGLYTHQHTVVDNFSPNPGDLTYFPEYLQQAGYKTAFFGKWHMGDDTDAPQPGFDHWESFRGQGVYYGPTLNINGERVQYGEEIYTTDLLTRHALEWLANQDPDQPCFVYLSHKAVHAEFMPAKRHEGVYEGNRIELPPTYNQTKTCEWRDLKWPEWVAKQRVSWHGVDYMYHENKDMQELVTDYCETLLAVDDSIAAVLDYLDERDLAQSSLVLYMGDNGFSWGEHGLIDKRHFYEESAKVPFIMRYPQLIAGGKQVDAIVANIDVAPTLLDAVGADIPGYLPGRSLLNLFNGNDNPDWRDTFYYEYYWEYDFPMTPTVFGIREGNFKYIRYHGIWDRNELYNLDEDPYEMINLIEDPDQQERVRHLANKLYDWLESTGGMQIPLKRTVKYRWGDYRHQDQF